MENSLDFELVARAKKLDWINIFLVVNPVTAIVSQLIIEKYGLNRDNVVFVSLRNSELTEFGFEALEIQTSLLDRLFAKVLGINRRGLRLAKALEALKTRFIVYTSWMHPEADSLVSSPLCQGYFLIEEGQQSYYPANEYSYGARNWRARNKAIQMGSYDHFYRNDYVGCFGLTRNSFPNLDKTRLQILDNMTILKTTYKAKLMGITNIGILPAPRRLPRDFLQNAADKFSDMMPEGGVVKMHPGFAVHKDYAKEFELALERSAGKRITCCGMDVILEIEMLFEKKVIFGPRSSVEIYAKTLGSNFSRIRFDGYIEPKN